MRRLRLLTLALAALTVGGGGARADVKKFAYLCGTHEGVQQICAFYQIALTPPDGWVVEETASKQNKVQMLVPNGKNFATAPALIYIQVFYHRDKQQTLDDFAKVSNTRWLANVPNAKITPLPAVERTNARRASCALPSKIRAAPSRLTSSAPSASTTTPTATNSCSTW